GRLGGDSRGGSTVADGRLSSDGRRGTFARGDASPPAGGNGAGNFDRLVSVLGIERMNQVNEFGLPAESPGFVEHAPGEDRWMIEIALDGFAHHSRSEERRVGKECRV